VLVFHEKSKPVFGVFAFVGLPERITPPLRVERWHCADAKTLTAQPIPFVWERSQLQFTIDPLLSVAFRLFIPIKKL